MISKKTGMITLTILALLCTGGYVFFYHTKEGTALRGKTPLTLLVPQKKLLPVPKDLIVEIDPWSSAAIAPMIDPPLPQAKELHAIYEQLFVAAVTHDYDQFQQLAAPDMVWHMEHQHSIKGDTVDGIMLYELLGMSGEEAFRLHGPYSVLFFSPEIDELVPGAVKADNQATYSSEYFYVHDTKAKKILKVKTVKWPTRVELSYTTKSKRITSGTGGVSFIYHKGKWLFSGMHWSVQGTTGDKYGDLIDIGTKTHEVSVDDKTGSCMPLEAKIKQGDALVWKNFTGKISNIDKDQDSWASPFLYNKNTYVKRFDTPGAYNYLAQTTGKRDIDIVKCRVVVE